MRRWTAQRLDWRAALTSVGRIAPHGWLPRPWPQPRLDWRGRPRLRSSSTSGKRTSRRGGNRHVSARAPTAFRVHCPLLLTARENAVGALGQPRHAPFSSTPPWRRYFPRSEVPCACVCLRRSSYPACTHSRGLRKSPPTWFARTHQRTQSPPHVTTVRTHLPRFAPGPVADGARSGARSFSCPSPKTRAGGPRSHAGGRHQLEPNWGALSTLLHRYRYPSAVLMRKAGVGFVRAVAVSWVAGSSGGDDEHSRRAPRRSMRPRARGTRRSSVASAQWSQRRTCAAHKSCRRCRKLTAFSARPNRPPREA